MFKAMILSLGSLVLYTAAGALAVDKESGKATVYSNKFEGRKTANGQRFSQHKLTAASPNLPMGSKVLVKNKKTGKSAVVTINDRESHGGGKVVDLSKASANKLGVKGTAPVEAKVVAKGKGK